ncbi:MAG: PAS domain S-box protein [Haloarculaceae archaeon]
MSDGPGGSIRVLHVDDDPDVAELVATHLERADDALAVETETAPNAALERLADAAVDCVVSDFDMPGMDGLALLRAVRESHPDLPFVLFTGKGSEEIASEAISAGVTDYLQKETGTDQYAVLANRIRRAVEERRAKSALRESERTFSTLVANLPGIVYRCRNETGWPMEFVSGSVRELTGHDPDDIEAGRVDWGRDVIEADERDRVDEIVQAAVAEDEPFELTYRARTADGEQRWFWERGRIVGEDDSVELLEGFITDVTDRRERERELEAERSFTRTILDALEDVFFVVDADGEFVRWNDSLTEATGYDDEAIASMTAIDFFPPESREAAWTAFDRLRDEETVEFETVIETRDGERVPMEFRETALRDEDGAFTGFAGIARDVSARKERERELERYRTLVEAVGDPMYVLGPDGHIEMANQALIEQLGYDRDEIVGAKPTKFADEDAVDEAERLIDDLLHAEDRSWGTVEARITDADGEVTICEDKLAVITEDGEYRGSVGVIRDVTERMQRQQELERYEAIIEAVGDPVYALDSDGRFTYVNDAIEVMAGHAPESLLGEHIGTVMDDDDVERGDELIRDLLAHDDRSFATFEMDLVTRDGEHIPCENNVALLPAGDGKFHGTAGVLRDVTDRASRERRLEEFASVVSHDLRGPLNVVQGRVDLARETGSTDDLAVAADAAERMERLIDDLLTLARQGEDLGEVRHVDLGAIAERAWADLATGEATLRVDATGGLEADPGRLRELLENLFGNAIEHGAAREDAGDLTVRIGDTDGGFFVADDGCGIPPDEREAVFERGHTTSDDGTGFGLSIVADVAAAHDWTVDVSESDGGGARFEICT